MEIKIERERGDWRESEMEREGDMEGKVDGKRKRIRREK